jgi:hypothetical protein
LDLRRSGGAPVKLSHMTVRRATTRASKLTRQQDADWQQAIGKARAALDALSEAVGAYNMRLSEVQDMAIHVWRLASPHDARSER